MRYLRILPVIAVALFAVAAYAADTANEVYIYRGGPLAQDGITAGSWGSGRAAESKDKAVAGTYSIKITTQSLYSGGRIDFAQPVTLFAGEPEKDRYIVFSFFFDEATRVDPAAGTNNEIEADIYSIPKATKVRFIFTNDKGVMTSIEEPSGQLDPDDNWVRIAIPLSKLKAAEGGGYKLSRLMVFTDLASTLYLGEIRLVTDPTPIKLDISGMQMFGVNTKAFFLGSARGGLSPLVYSWDYDASDGLQTESTGMVGSHVFTRGGDFKVTLTVSDANGVKEPVSQSYTVSVND